MQTKTYIFYSLIKTVQFREKEELQKKFPDIDAFIQFHDIAIYETSKMSIFEIEKDLDTRNRQISEKNNDILVICVEINPNKFFPLTTDEKYSKKHKMLYKEEEESSELAEKYQLNMFANKFAIKPELEDQIREKHAAYQKVRQLMLDAGMTEEDLELLDRESNDDIKKFEEEKKKYMEKNLDDCMKEAKHDIQKMKEKFIEK